MIIDAHAHLRKKQNGIVNGKPVCHIGENAKIFLWLYRFIKND